MKIDEWGYLWMWKNRSIVVSAIISLHCRCGLTKPPQLTPGGGVSRDFVWIKFNGDVASVEMIEPYWRLPYLRTFILCVTLFFIKPDLRPEP